MSDIAAKASVSSGLGSRLAYSPPFVAGAVMLLTITIVSVMAPILTPYDPMAINISSRLAPASTEYWLGTDRMGRDIFTRAIYGGRVSLLVGLSVAALAVLLGLTLGLVVGYVQSLDRIVMRLMDALMAIPTILLAIAVIALTGPSVLNVILVLAVPDVPRVVRLVRSIVLTVREEPYVEAARTLGTPFVPMLLRHVLPNTVGPLIVLTSYICAGAVISEAALSFLGVGLPPEIPSWGSMIAEGRVVFQVSPFIVFVPGFLLSLTVLGINLLGDGLRDELDPKQARRL